MLTLIWLTINSIRFILVLMLSTDKYRIINSLRKEGYKNREIAKKLGLSNQVVANIVFNMPSDEEIKLTTDYLSSLTIPESETVVLEEIKEQQNLVYVFLSEDNLPLYVGSSLQGIYRVAFKSKNEKSRHSAWLKTRKVLLYWVDNPSYMKALETKLICMLKTPYNLEFGQARINGWAVGGFMESLYGIKEVT